MRNFLVIITILAFSFALQAQSRRITPNPTANKTVAENSVSANEPSSESFYNEANSYAKKKFEEFNQKKVPFNEALRQKTFQEQKQLAAKYAMQLSVRKNLLNEDFYYLGMLHWLAENFDKANENLSKYLTFEDAKIDNIQTSRFVLIIIFAQRKRFDEAENLLSDYLRANPVKLSERSKMESELAKNYREAKQLEKAAKHAEESYRVSKALFKDATTRSRGLNEILANAEILVDIYTENRQFKKVEETLLDLRDTGSFLESIGVYYTAIDELIKFFIETDRKPQALEFYTKSLKDVETAFVSKDYQNQIIRQLKTREKHYRLLKENAIELVNLDQWIGQGETKYLKDLRGKVVLLDFWATWCGPCIVEFPKLNEFAELYQKDGFYILGLTRYYGEVGNETATTAEETTFVKNFKLNYKINYDLVIAKDSENARNYKADSLPTKVLIDRKGVVRYLFTGSGHEAELEKWIKKLIAEK